MNYSQSLIILKFGMIDLLEILGEIQTGWDIKYHCFKLLSCKEAVVGCWIIV